MKLLRVALESSKTALSVDDVIAETSSGLPEGYSLIVATTDRASDIVNLRKKLHAESDFVNQTTVPIEERNIRQFEGNGLYLLVLHDSKIVGLCISYVMPDEDKIHIGLLAVLKEHGRRGLASSMILAIKGYGSSKRLKGLSLYVDGENPNAQKLYKLMGLVRTEEHTYYRMECPLK